MARTTCTQRLVILTASTALAAGGALIPSSAFAAPAPQIGAVSAKAPTFDHHDKRDRNGERKREKTKIVFKTGKTKIVIVVEKKTVKKR
ncbi:MULTISPECIES: hypothetical protein [Streptomyces]|uniref:Uncharacterized protein n=1 Tax=Streptomyces pratisoli TaxID=3139917 RepID=A0ACC6QFA7_9ACTN|nr:MULTISPECIES: hypothetical protein [unclassified Streptomyces]MCX4509299.1 hypothetical protein [Streptomyces sp. NBC_01619]